MLRRVQFAWIADEHGQDVAVVRVNMNMPDERPNARAGQQRQEWIREDSRSYASALDSPGAHVAGVCRACAGGQTSTRIRRIVGLKG